jgi:hypothetical protein
VPPKYVALAGEGSFDYKDYMGYGDCLVPPLMTAGAENLYVSDNLYADVTGDDGVPELAIGRIPAASAQELSEYIAKIIAYEAATGDWTRRAVFAADALDAGGNFSASSDEVAALAPANFTLDRIYLDSMQVADARADILAGLTEGRAYFNFIGHGGPALLGNANLVSIDDIAQLSKGDRLPVVTAMTCMVGNFGFPGFDSLSEAMVIMQDGGAAAMWSSSDFAYNQYSAQLCKGFYDAVFISGKKTLGDAIHQAQLSYAQTGTKLYYLNLYNLLGDPALVIK